jgi:hypothetical protein
MDMKKGVVLAVSILNLALGSNLAAANHTNHGNVFQQVQEGGNGEELRTFSGTVWKNGSKFVLRDESHKLWYQLDDQRSAARFEGKQVKVTGTLDAARDVIHILEIAEDPIKYGKTLESLHWQEKL